MPPPRQIIMIDQSEIVLSLLYHIPAKNQPSTLIPGPGWYELFLKDWIPVVQTGTMFKSWHLPNSGYNPISFIMIHLHAPNAVPPPGDSSGCQSTS